MQQFLAEREPYSLTLPLVFGSIANVFEVNRGHFAALNLALGAFKFKLHFNKLRNKK